MTTLPDARGTAREPRRLGIVRTAAAALAFATVLGSAQAQVPTNDPSLPVPQPPFEETAASRAEAGEERVEEARVGAETSTDIGAMPEDPSQPVPQPPLETAANSANDKAERAEDNTQLAALPGVRAQMPSCVPSALVAAIRRIEQDFGPVEVISSYRKGAVVAGTGRRSKHADCRAVDFRPAKGTYRQVANWLKANHDGGVGTYSGHHNHIHIDNGGRYRWHN